MTHHIAKRYEDMQAKRTYDDLCRKARNRAKQAHDSINIFRVEAALSPQPVFISTRSAKSLDRN